MCPQPRTVSAFQPTPTILALDDLTSKAWAGYVILSKTIVA